MYVSNVLQTVVELICVQHAAYYSCSSLHHWWQRNVHYIHSYRFLLLGELEKEEHAHTDPLP